MTIKRRNPAALSCDQNANRPPYDLAARYAQICVNPMVWPLTAQVPPASGRGGPSAFVRWFRKGLLNR